MGSKKMVDIVPFDCERLKGTMAKAKRAKRTIHYGLAVVRQVINTASSLGFHEGINPAGKEGRVKKPNSLGKYLFYDCNTQGAHPQGKGKFVTFEDGITRTTWLLANKAGAFPVRCPSAMMEQLHTAAGLKRFPPIRLDKLSEIN